MSLRVVEICAGAGGQALGLEQAGFEHELAVELDANACATLRLNRPGWKISQGDVADPEVWMPQDYAGIDLLAGGVPCPPFTIAGKQLGATDERDLFAWAVELAGKVRPRALMLENVRGLSMPRFSGYRQHVLDRLTSFGYVGEWKLLQASDFGVPQLRPRFVLVALNADDAPYFRWPKPEGSAPTVGQTLFEAMASDGWEGANSWADQANDIAPTIVGGSKKHGGADLGPTRAKRAWAQLGVDALGVADAPPPPGAKYNVGPKLTTPMVEQIQGWAPGTWVFSGRKTSRYRQIGNAFPPPVARAVGCSIQAALKRAAPAAIRVPADHDPIYRVLREADCGLTRSQIQRLIEENVDAPEFERRMSLLSRDFDLHAAGDGDAVTYRLGAFRAFTGQDEHIRNELFAINRSRIS